MHFLGYLLTLANLSHMNSRNSPNDVTVRVGDLETITNEIQNIPGFSLEGFRQSGYQRQGSVGIYISKSVQNYVFNREGNPDDEGIILVLFFADPAQDASSTDDRQTLFLHTKPVDNDVQQLINSYAETGRWPKELPVN